MTVHLFSRLNSHWFFEANHICRCTLSIFWFRRWKQNSWPQSAGWLWFSVTAADLHLWPQHCVVTGQLSAVDGVHSIHWCLHLCVRWRCCGAALCFWDGGAGSAVKLEKRLNISAVLVGQSFLILVRPLADSALPSLSCVLIQNVGLHCWVLDRKYKIEDQGFDFSFFTDNDGHKAELNQQIEWITMSCMWV